MDKIDFQCKRILVTGGNGYLGTFLCAELEKCNAEVYILDRKTVGKPNEFGVDISNREEVFEIVNKIRPQIVFHLAALLHRERSFIDYDNIHAVNYTGTLNLLLALRENPCEKFVFTSTSEIYGANIAPFTENMQPQPVSPYSITKVLSENVIQIFSNLYGQNYTILRLFNFYGENMPKSFFIPELLDSLENKDTFKMTCGEQTRDFLYVKDVIQAMILSAFSKEADCEIFNVCSGKGITLRDFVLECKDALDSSCNIEFGAIPYRDNEVWDMVGDNSKITERLGFKASYTIDSLTKPCKEFAL